MPQERIPWFFGIGIDAYEDFPPLANAAKDVRDVASLLVARYGFSFANTRLLLNGAATQSNIIDMLERIVEDISPDESVIIYFSGHGHFNQRTQIGYWIPSDAKPRSNATYISNSTVRDYTRAVQSKHTLIISDSCFSGSLFVRGVERRNAAAQQLHEIPSRWAICSGRHDEQVLDGPPGANSPFAKSIIDALSGNRYPMLRVAHLAARVVDQTRSNYTQLPEGGPLHGVGHSGGEFVFRLTEKMISEEERLWRKCQTKSDASEVQRYLAEYPSGEHAEAAQRLMRQLEEKEAWREALQAATADAMRSYVNRYPVGSFAAEAQAQLLSLDQDESVEVLTQAPPAGEETDNASDTVALMTSILLLGIYFYISADWNLWFEGSWLLPAVAVWAAHRSQVTANRFLVYALVCSLVGFSYFVGDDQAGFGHQSIHLLIGAFMIMVVRGWDWQSAATRLRGSYWKLLLPLSLCALMLVDGTRINISDTTAMTVDISVLIVGMLLVVALRKSCIGQNNSGSSAHREQSGFSGRGWLMLSLVIGLSLIVDFNPSDGMELSLGMYSREAPAWFLAFALCATRLFDWRVILGLVCVTFIFDQHGIALITGFIATAQETISGELPLEAVVTASRSGPGAMAYLDVHTMAAALLGAALAPYVVTRDPRSLASINSIGFLLGIVVLQSLPSSQLPVYTMLGTLGGAFIAGLAWPGWTSRAIAILMLIAFIVSAGYLTDQIDAQTPFRVMFVGGQLLVMSILGSRLRQISIAREQRG